MGEGEDATGEGGQKACRLGWEVVLARDWGEGEEEGAMLLLTALPLLLMPLALTLLLARP